MMELTIMQMILYGTILAGICLFAGTFIGMVLAAIMMTAKRADEWMERVERGEVG